MFGSGVDAKIAELLSAERTAREHALNRLFDYALGMLAAHDRAGRPLLDAADVTCVVVIYFLLQLVAGEQRPGGIDDDDIVAAIHMRRIAWLVFAPEPHGNDGGKPADNEAICIDQHPLLFDLGGLGRVGLHECLLHEGRRRPRQGAGV